MAKRKPPKMRGGAKNKIVQVQSSVNRHELVFQRYFARQFVLDAATLAANEVFGAGELRQSDFYVSINKWLVEISEMILDDSKSDQEIVYSKQKLDEALKPLMGRNFQPYDQRYSPNGEYIKIKFMPWDVKYE